MSEEKVIRTTVWSAGPGCHGGCGAEVYVKDGKVVKLQIESTAGGTLRLLSPWPRIKADGKPLEADQRGVVEIRTNRGTRITFSP